jgi:predicted RecB family nuclease
MVLTELEPNPGQHVSTMLPGLSTDAEDFLENIDITYIEELIELTGEN